MSNLLNETRRLLTEARKGASLSAIAAGAGLKSSWVHLFATSEGTDFGVMKVQQLHDYLAARTAEDEGAAA